MFLAKIIVTNDGTGSFDRPDTVVETFEKEFDNISEAYNWVMKQNCHPWLTCHLDKKNSKIVDNC